MWHVLVRHRSFRRLWIAASVDSLGSWLLVMAVPVYVYRVTGSATSTSLALAIEALPAVLIGSWAGVAVDRYPRRTVLVVANLLSAAGVADDLEWTLLIFSAAVLVAAGLLPRTRRPGSQKIPLTSL